MCEKAVWDGKKWSRPLDTVYSVLFRVTYWQDEADERSRHYTAILCQVWTLIRSFYRVRGLVVRSKHSYLMWHNLPTFWSGPVLTSNWPGIYGPGGGHCMGWTGWRAKHGVIVVSTPAGLWETAKSSSKAAMTFAFSPRMNEALLFYILQNWYCRYLGGQGRWDLAIQIGV